MQRNKLKETISLDYSDLNSINYLLKIAFLIKFKYVAEFATTYRIIFISHLIICYSTSAQNINHNSHTNKNKQQKQQLTFITSPIIHQ